MIPEVYAFTEGLAVVGGVALTTAVMVVGCDRWQLVMCVCTVVVFVSGCRSAGLSVCLCVWVYVSVLV